MTTSMAQGYSIHVGVGQTRCVDNGGTNYAVLEGIPNAATRMAAIADQTGYQSRVVLLSPPDRPSIAGRSATKPNFLEALEAATRTVRAGDHLLITFAGHGERTHATSESGWVFEDQKLFRSELVPLLHGVAAGARILVISESCFAGGLIGQGIPDGESRVPSPECNPAIIQIGAAYDYEYAQARGGVLFFTACLVDVWNHGGFEGSHQQFTDEIGERMKQRFDAGEGGRYFQEPRYLVSARTANDMEAFEKLTPFWVGGRPGRSAAKGA